MAGRRNAEDHAGAPPKVFISATSKDLGTVHELVKQALLTMGCMPVEQSNFAPDYRSVHEMIEHKIAGCEAVIHIVGHRYGAEPDPTTLPDGTPRRSYTQLEADIARQLGKKLYLFVCPEDFPYDDALPEREELQTLQNAYRAEISKSKTIRTKVANREELSRKVRELQFELEKLRTTMGRHRRRVMALLVVLVLALGGIGAGIWWWLPTVVKKEVGYDRTKAREQLVTDIKETAKKKIAEAGDDWRKAMEIEKSRDQQLADLDRFLERIDYTFEAGEATESYRKATNLLSTKGADEALAYLQARSRQRQSLIDAQVSRRDQEETDLRKLLQEDLLAASLLTTKFQLDAAEAKYRLVLDKSGSWPKARNDFAWFLIERGMSLDPVPGNAKLREAVQLCRSALVFESRDKTPQDWAQTHTDLGIALSQIGVRSDIAEEKKYLQEAAEAFRSALEVYTREQTPQNWALIQTNIGRVFREIAIRSGLDDKRKYLHEALLASRGALEVFTQEQQPQLWVEAQANLSEVLRQIAKSFPGEEQSEEHLQEAVAASRSALNVFTSTQEPYLWATVQDSLGDALTALGTRSGAQKSKENLQEAAAAYRSALEIFTRERYLQYWAGNQCRLGDVLVEMGQSSVQEKLSESEESKKYLQEAAAAYRSALEIFTREQMGRYWSQTQLGLASALMLIGISSTNLQEAGESLLGAVAAYRDALEYFTRDQEPEEWALIQFQLGNLLQHIGSRTRGEVSKNYLQEALVAYRSVLEESTVVETNPHGSKVIQMARRALEETQDSLAKISP